MGILEIVLLIIGGVIFVLSFIIPVQKEEISEETKAVAKEEIEMLVTKEMESIRSHVDDVVDEAIEYAMEKTERSLERLSNEKIMAVNEYSDTVLQEIHRNHEEVMFLYDMLNDKHTNLKNTVTEVNKTVKEVSETKKEAEAVVQSFRKLTPETVYVEDGYVVDEKNINIQETENDSTEENNAYMDIVTEPGVSAIEGNANGYNQNERILELYQQNKSEVVIARELGLGVGEVRLVIDLYKSKAGNSL